MASLSVVCLTTLALMAGGSMLGRFQPLMLREDTSAGECTAGTGEIHD